MRILDFVKWVTPGLIWLGLMIQSCAPPPSSSLVSVGGDISGLTGVLVLQNNGGEDLTLEELDDFYAFSISENGFYNIKILTQPAGQTCSFINDNNVGTVGSRDINNIDIDCTNNANKIIFITAATSEGNFGGISGADDFCMADMNKPNSSDYKALIVGSATRVACGTPNCSGGTLGQTDWVLAPDTTYVRSDGITTIGTTNSDGIFDFPLENSFTGSTGFFWTGLNNDWTTSTNDCLNGMTVMPWDTSSGGSSGELGSTNQVSGLAISNGSDTCGTFKSLACVEQ